MARWAYLGLSSALLMSFWRGLAERWFALASPIRRLLLIGLAASVIGGLLFWIAIPHWIASAVESRARSRGIDLTIGRVSLGLGKLWLEDVIAQDPLLPGSRVKVASASVAKGWGRTEVLVRGVDVEVNGSTKLLLERWRALFPARRPGTSEPANSSARLLDAGGINGVWRDPQSARSIQVWGGHLRQEQGGALSVGFGRMRAVTANANVEVKTLQAGLVTETTASGERQRRFEQVQAASVDSELSLSLAPAEPAAQLSAKSVAAVAAPITPTPVGGAEREHASWQSQLRAVQAALRALTTATFKASVGAVTTELKRGPDSLRIGPNALQARRTAHDAYLDVVPSGNGANGGTPFSLRAHLPLGDGAIAAELSGGPVPLSTLGIREGDMGLVAVRETRIEAQAKITYDPANPLIELTSQGRLENARLRRPAISQNELSDIRVGWRMSGRVSPVLDNVTLSEGEFSIGDVRMNVGGTIEREPAPLRVDLKAEMPLTACSSLLEALPHGMAPLLNNVRMQGTFSARGLLQFDSQKPLATAVRLEVKNQCRIAEVPPAISPRRFRNPWTREVKGADGLPMTIESGPGSPDWTPYEDISPFLETAIVVCEDAGFFSHQGLDYRAIENSIRMNLEAGRFLRGASTVSMQLAKNLYLGREKTISRKFQEAILTQLLEQELSKHELLELYLNVIEFGPGIYGIRQAARHYFNEEPRNLSLGQALYLASILPSPDTQHFAPDGRVTERWSGYLRRLMQIARKIKRISDEELRAGEAEQVAFRKPNENPPQAPAFDEEVPEEP